MTSPVQEWPHSVAARRLNERGQCCGRKPIHYKGGSYCSPPGSPMKFCTVCSREYSVETGEQKENWAYRADGPGYFRVQDHNLARAMK
jgi:hypothetical protein